MTKSETQAGVVYVSHWMGQHMTAHHEVRQDGSKGFAQLGKLCKQSTGELTAHLLHELYDLLLRGVARQELVKVGDHVHADGAGQGVVHLWEGIG